MPALDVSTSLVVGEPFQNWIADGMASLVRDAFLGFRAHSQVRVLNLVSGTAAQAQTLIGARSAMDTAWPALFGTDPTEALPPGAVCLTTIANVEQLPFRDQSYDVVISLFGAMLAPRPVAMQSEMLRVCRSGGRLLMANWTPASVFGHTLRLVSKHSPHADLSRFPQAVLWGDECAMIDQLRGRASDLRFKTRSVKMRFTAAPSDVAANLCKSYSPLTRVLGALPIDDQTQIRSKLAAIWARRNVAGAGATEVVSDYLTVTATRV